MTSMAKRSAKERAISDVPSVEPASAIYTFVFGIAEKSCCAREFSNLGSRIASFFAGIMIVRSLVVLMDLRSFLIDGDVGGRSLDPTSGVEIFHAALGELHGLVGVAAKDALRIVRAGVGQRAGGDLGRVPPPAGVEAVDKLGEALLPEVQLLQQQKRRRGQAAQQGIVSEEAVELMSVDRQVAHAAVLPNVLLVNLDPHQVRHDQGKAVIVVAFHPHYLDAALGVRELADVRQQAPR